MYSMLTKKINKVKIEPVVTTTNNNPKKIVGYDYFPEPYANIMLNARKQSGKSSVIYQCMQHCATKKSKVIIFSPTHDRDAVYIRMKAMLEKKGCKVEAFRNFEEDGVNHINALISLLTPKKVIGEKKSAMEIQNRAVFAPTDLPMSIEKKEKLEKKSSGKIAPDYIIIFDDLSSLMRDPCIGRLLSYNRHFKLKCFIACHGINNLDLLARNMIDYVLLFPNISKDKITELVDSIGLEFKDDTKKDKKVHQIYDHATAPDIEGEKSYNFLNISKVNMSYRRNFDEEYEL